MRLITSSRAVAPRNFLLPVEFGAAPREFLRTHLRNVVVVELPGRIRAPAQRRLHRGARAGSALQKSEREFKRQRLRIDIMRLAGGVAEREVAEQEARHRR